MSALTLLLFKSIVSQILSEECMLSYGAELQTAQHIEQIVFIRFKVFSQYLIDFAWFLSRRQ